MIPLEKINKIIGTYEKLEKELSSGDISKKDFVQKSKEYSLQSIQIAKKCQILIKTKQKIANLGKKGDRPAS